jgi:hypothetical protein
MSWSIEDPLAPKAPIKNERFTHKNPMVRPQLGQMRRQVKTMVDSMRLKWHIKIDCEFMDAYGKAYYKPVEMVIHGILQEADEDYLCAVESVFSEANMSQYRNTHIVATVLGDAPICDGDFSDD